MAHCEDESVSDFIRRLERTFHAAYGRDPMSLETRETLLHGQLQDGLRLNCSEDQPCLEPERVQSCV